MPQRRAPGMKSLDVVGTEHVFNLTPGEHMEAEETLEYLVRSIHWPSGPSSRGRIILMRMLGEHTAINLASLV